MTSDRKPDVELRAIVVIPAHDEEERIGACLDALAHQEEIDPAAFEVIVVLDACTDGTEERVAAAQRRHPRMPLMTMPGPGRGAGPARAIGMDAACLQLESTGRTDVLLATTDADTVVAPDWIARQLDAIDGGAEAIGGDILLDEREAGLLPARVIHRRESELAGRTRVANRAGPAEHAHFAGASLGLTPRAYRAAGGMGELASLEDRDLEERLVSAGVRIHRPGPVRVTTSARTSGRADRGLALDLAVSSWTASRTFDGSSYTAEQLVAAKTSSIGVVLPAREVASTIGRILERLSPLRDLGLIDELLVVDANSTDGTAEICRELGVRTCEESSLSPEFGPCLGKGDAMWRGARAVESDLLVFMDTDTADFEASFLTGLVGPLILEPGLRLVKGTFERPLEANGSFLEGEGGRVTELVARPLLNLDFPALAGFAQPLAGEIAIERHLFLQLPVPVGYGVEIAMLIDCLRLAGLDALAQSDLGVRQNRHQSLRSLSAMATEVMVAAKRRSGDARRPGVVPFRPRPESGSQPELWNLHCQERPAGPGPEPENHKAPRARGFVN